jgi:hypothetical protein
MDDEITLSGRKAQTSDFKGLKLTLQNSCA